MVPDPEDGNILYGGGQRCDQHINVEAYLGGQLPAEDPDDLNRKTWTLPTVFSPKDEALYYSNQFVFRSRDRSKTWEKISPDLARLNPPQARESGSAHGEGYRSTDDGAFRRGVFDQPFALAGHDGLGRHGRWVDSRDARRWQDLERCDAAADDAVEQGVADRSRTFRCGDGVCFGRPASSGRYEALHLSHA